MDKIIECLRSAGFTKIEGNFLLIDNNDDVDFKVNIESAVAELETGEAQEIKVSEVQKLKELEISLNILGVKYRSISDLMGHMTNFIENEIKKAGKEWRRENGDFSIDFVKDFEYGEQKNKYSFDRWGHFNLETDTDVYVVGDIDWSLNVSNFSPVEV